MVPKVQAEGVEWDLEGGEGENRLDNAEKAPLALMLYYYNCCCESSLKALAHQVCQKDDMVDEVIAVDFEQKDVPSPLGPGSGFERM
ncbi:hypothetical protein BGZ80_007694 [Entomortierella chlamydospora]|uniref:Uncharacterized protein n=1 Tax=Entomortierella chlamydospora TaxID=101097 RepID=A0A9P6MXW6_9FUNG|nr:hypothetical protein BGZ80_007694 [Entomortierella chlamydospora]